jgi:mono/diheme cytochrome c family protein
LKRIFKTAGLLGLALVFLLIAIALTAKVFCARKLERVVEVQVSPVTLPTDPASLQHGKYLYDSRGCAECHGADGSGKVVIDAPNGFLVKAPDITLGQGGVTAAYQPADWVRTIRHGVKPNGNPLFLMPSEDYNRLTDVDVGDLAAYVLSLPPQTGSGADIHLPLLLQALYGFDAIKDSAEKIDHNLPPAKPVAEAISIEHGAYISSTCSGCHGPGFSGGKIPGTPPDWPPAANLTPGPGSVMPRYDSLDKFKAMLRSGQRPDGSAVSKVMPFASLKTLNDVDVAALYMYLKTVPAQARGNR